MDSHTTCPAFKTRWLRYTFYRTSDWPPPHQHHQFVWMAGEGFPDRVRSKILEWVIVYSSVALYINGYHKDRSAPCLYTVTGWGVMSCVCSMVFLCGSTLVKVSLLQEVTDVIWPQMFKSDVKPEQIPVWRSESIGSTKTDRLVSVTVGVSCPVSAAWHSRCLKAM